MFIKWEGSSCIAYLVQITEEVKSLSLFAASGAIPDVSAFAPTIPASGVRLSEYANVHKAFALHEVTDFSVNLE